jgi:hypothetical protein
MATERGVTGRDKQVDVDLPPRRAGSEWTELTLDRGRVALTTSVSQASAARPSAGASERESALYAP